MQKPPSMYGLVAIKHYTLPARVPKTRRTDFRMTTICSLLGAQREIRNVNYRLLLLIIP